jgi:eukaryotic-like serine/threonine-protein kinase
MRVVPDDKRTQIGPTGPVRPATGTGRAVAATATPTPTPFAAAATPAPITDPPGAATSYLPPGTDPMLGQVLAGRYLIQKKLGEGGMGAVYLATHNVLEKQVALKVLHGEFARKPDLVERFMQEAKAASRIRHENVIDISDFGTTPDGLVFFAMELLQGHDLHEEIARARLVGQLLPWQRSKRIFLQICAALSAAHALGIIHRDLKPENIYLVEFLGEPDFVKLLDFGIAKLTEVADGERKLTRTGMLFGTPEYMSPEQARGDNVDHRVDVYAMGCILFQLVTGRVPFEAENFMGVLSLHLTQPPPAIPPEVFDSIGAPRALAQVIDRALAKDRNQRFATIDELSRAVRNASGDKVTGPVATQGNVAAPSSTATFGRVKTQWTGNLSVPEVDPAAPPTRSRLPVVVGAVLLAGGAAAVAAVLVSRGGSAPPGDTANAAKPVTAPPAPPAAVPPPAPMPPPPAPMPPPPAPMPPPPAPMPSPIDTTPLRFESSSIRLDSTPSHAEVRDPATGKLLGQTPFKFILPASHIPRQFALHHQDYGDVVVEIIPEHPQIKQTVPFERGAPGQPPVVHPADSTRRPPPRPGTPELRPPPPPPPGPGVPEIKPAPPGPGVPEIKPPPPPRPAPPPDDDSIPQLKPDPSRAGSGSGTP